MRHLGGSVSWASDFGSGRDLPIHEFELSARSLLLDPLSPSLSAPPLLVLSQKQIIFFFKRMSIDLISVLW